MFEHILPDRQLRMSPYHKMRDPVESQDVLPDISWFGDPPRADQATRAVLADIKATRDAMRVLAFSRDAGDGVRRPILASTVPGRGLGCGSSTATSTRGACLLFDRDRLEAFLQNEVGDERIYGDDVRYDRQGIAGSPVQHVTDERIFDEKQRQQAVAEHIDRYRRDFFFLKSDDFATEAEYRIVLKTDDDPPVGYTTDEQGYAHVGYGDALVAVVLRSALPKVAEAWSPGGLRPCGHQDAAYVVGARETVLLGTGQSS